MKHSHTKHPYAHIKRAAAGGVLLFLLSACGSGGGATAPTQAAPAGPAGPQTQILTLTHGKGWLCTVWQSQKVYCWASEAAAVTDGDAAWMGLTDTTPKLIYDAHGMAGFVITPYDHGILVNENGSILPFGTPVGSQVNTSVEPDVSCDVTGTDSVHCPGEAVGDLTFSWLGADPHDKHYPHSPTWKHVHRTAANPHTRANNAGAGEGFGFSPKEAA